MNLKTAVDLSGRPQALESIEFATASHFTNLVTTAVAVTACRHKTWPETESSTAVFRFMQSSSQLGSLTRPCRSLNLCLILVLSSGAGVLKGDTLPVAGDAHISSAFSAVNCGNVPYLGVGSGSHAFIRFDPSLLASVAVEDVRQVNLILWVGRVSVGGVYPCFRSVGKLVVGRNYGEEPIGHR